MWSSAHASVGGIIVLATPDPVIGLGLAFLSHFFLDYIGERGYKSLKEAAFIEGSLLLVYIGAAVASGSPWLLMGAWVASNLPDLIDKPRRLIWGKKEWFSCHDGEGIIQGFGAKLGFPTIVTITYWQTIAINVGSTVLFAIIAALSN